MDFANSEIAKLAMDLASKMAPNARKLDNEEVFPRENLDLLGKQGLLGMVLPPPLGGGGADTHSFLQVAEALGAGCPSTAFLFATHVGASVALLAKGTDDQRKKYLGDVASGKLLCGLAGTEAGGGSNPMAIQTHARREGEDYLLDGSKVYISGAGEADLYLVLARTDKQPGPRCLTAFLVEKQTAGCTVGSLEDKLGFRAIPTGELVFEGCRLPAEARLGEEGEGIMVIGIAAGLAALGAGAMAVGMAQAACDLTREHIGARAVAGRKLAELEGVQLRFADMLTELSAARALLHRAAHAHKTRAADMVPTIFQAKINATEKALVAIDTAIQLHGAAGYSRELPLEKWYRDARALRIHFGTNDVLRINMSKIVLGLL